MKGKLIRAIMASVAAFLAAIGLAACGGTVPVPSGGTSFEKFEGSMQAFQRAYAEIANELEEQDNSGSATETDKQENGEPAKKEAAAFAASVSKPISASLFDELEASVRTNNTYRASYSHTLGLWQNELPETILGMQLRPLVYAKLADSVKIDFLSENMNYRNDGCYAVSETEGGYTLEKAADAQDPNAILFYSYSQIGGSTREDISFTRQELTFSVNGDLIRVDFSALRGDRFLTLTASFEEGASLTETVPDMFTGEMYFSSLDEMRTYICKASPALEDPAKEAYIDAETAEEAREIYARASSAIYSCARKIAQESGVDADSAARRAAAMCADFVDISAKLPTEAGEGFDVYGYIQEYSDEFYRNFTFQPVQQDFYVENGVLTEYLGTADAVQIPEGVTTISEDCLLTGRELFLPESLEKIEPNKNPSCSLASIYGFEKVYIPEGNQNFYADGAVVRDKDGKAVFLVLNEQLQSIDYDLYTTYDLRNYASFVAKYDEDSAADPNFIYGKIESVREIIVGCGQFLSSDFQNYYPNLEKIVLRDDNGAKSLQINLGEAYGNLREIVLPDCVTEAYLDLSSNAEISVTANNLRVLDARGDALRSVSVPDSVREIFLQSDALTAADLPENAEKVTLNCRNLEELDLPESVLSLALECDKLTSLTIPQNVTDFSVRCANVTKLIFTGERTKIDRVLTTPDGMTDSELLSLREVVFPEGVTEIGQGAFALTSIQTLTLPQTVTVIGQGAFSDCRKLESVSLPQGLRSIGEQAFAQCSALRSAELPSSLTEIGDYAFSGCSSLGSADLPEGLLSLGEGAFERTAIRSLTVPASVRELGVVYCYGESDSLTIEPSENSLTVQIASRGENARIAAVTLPANVTEASVSCNVGLLTVYGQPKLDVSGASNIHFADLLEIDYEEYLETSGSRITSSAVLAFAEATQFFTVTYLNDDGSLLKTEQVLEGTRYVPSAEAQSSHAATAEQMYKFRGWILNGENVFGQQIIIRGPVTLTAAYELTETFAWEEIAGGVRILGYADAEYDPAEIVVPAALYGKTVTQIARGAFAQCTQAVKVTVPFTGCSDGGELFEIFGGYTLPASIREVVVTDSSLAGGFAGANQLGRITYESTVTQILPFAFERCSSLEEIVFEDNRAQSIGEYAFTNCTAARFVVPAQTKTIGEYAFLNAEAIRTEYGGSAEEWALVELGNEYSNPFYYTGELIADGQTVTELSLPAGITTIPAFAFFNCRSLLSAVIPDTVLSVGEGAFGGCTQLASISLPFTGQTKGGSENTHLGFIFGEKVYNPSGYRYESDNETYVPASLKTVKVTGTAPIAARAFALCTNLTEVLLPDGLTSVGRAAFAQSGIVRMTIPESVTSVGMSAFLKCDSLEYLCLPFSGNDSFIEGSSYGGFAELFEGDIPLSLREIEIRGTDEIDLSRISCNGGNVSTIRLSDEIKKITSPDYDMWKAPNLCFEGTLGEWLSVQFEYLWPEPVAENIYVGGVLLAGDISIPESVTSIPDHAFHSSAITSVTLPQGLTSIGYMAFADCTALETIRFNAADCTATESFQNSGTGSTQILIGAEVLRLCDGLFYGVQASALTFAENSKCQSIGDNALSSLGIETLTLPDGLLTIGNYAISNCYNLKQLIVPDSVIYIGEQAFANNYSLIQIEIPSHAQTGDGILSGISPETLSIPAEMFDQIAGYDSLRELTIKSGDLTADFSSLINLQKLFILQDVTNFSANLSALPNLEIYFDAREYTAAGYPGGGAVVTVGPHVSRIEDFLFATETLQKVFFEEGSICTYIGSSAFAGSALSYIELPASLQSIGVGAIGSGGSAPDIFYQGDVAGWCAIQDLGNLHVYGSGNGFALHIGGKPVENLTIPASVSKVADSAFRNIPSLVSVEFAADTQIGANAFENCAALERVSGKIRSVGEYAFYNCTALRSADLRGNAATEIGANAFLFCTALASLTLPDSLTSIGDYAFSDCSALASLALPVSLTSVGSGAFRNCAALTSLTIPENILSIGTYAFSGMVKLTQLNFNAVNCADLSSDNAVFENIGAESAGVAVTIGADVERVPSYMFCPSGSWNGQGEPVNITSVSFAENSACRSVGEQAFAYCRATEIFLPQTVESVQHRIFIGCAELEKVSLPDMEYVDEYTAHDAAFYFGADLPQTLEEVRVTGGTHLTEGALAETGVRIVYLAEGITELRAEAFLNCSSLEQVTAGQIRTVGDLAFGNCSSLHTFDTSACTAIGEQAFLNCGALRSFDLHSLLSAGSQAFNNTAAESVYTDSLSSWLRISFSSETSNPLYAGGGLYAGGELVRYIWADSVEDISQYAFCGYTALESVSVRSAGMIGKYAFSKCSSLTDVEFGAAADIGAYAFSECPSLVQASILSAGKLGDSLFYNCAALQTACLPEADFAPEGMFGGCTSLSDVTVPYISTVSEPNIFFNEFVFGSDDPSLAAMLRSAGVMSGYVITDTFDDCVNLQSVTLGEAVEYTSYDYVGLFRGCALLTDARIPLKFLSLIPTNIISLTLEGGDAEEVNLSPFNMIEDLTLNLTSIGQLACRSGLKTMTIGEKLTSIGPNVLSPLYSTSFEVMTGWRAYEADWDTTGISLDLAQETMQQTLTDYNSYTWRRE